MIARLVFVFALSMCSPVLGSTDLSTHCGHAIGNEHMQIISTPRDPYTCKVNCFHSVITCNNGRRLSFISRYNPRNPAFANTLTSLYPVAQALIFAAVAFLVFLTWRGAAASISANLTYLAAVALGMATWPRTTQWPIRTFTDLLFNLSLATAIYGLPIFLLLNAKAIVRGWNYVFVKHAAETVVTPSLQSGASIDTKALAGALSDSAKDNAAYPLYHYENQAQKARDLRGRLDAARAEVEAAERALEEAKRRAEHRR